MAIEKNNKVPGYESSGIGGAAVTPHDTNELNQIARVLSGAALTELLKFTT